MNLIERIRLWWKFEGRYYYKDFVNGVKNLIRWCPVIWKDRDWDDHFIWKLLIQKLKFQAKHIGDNDRHTRAKRDAEIMLTCVRLMEKIKDDYYGVEYMDYHDSDYDFVDCDKSGYKELQVTERKEWFDDYFKKYPLVYKKVKKEHPEFSKKTIALYVSLENHKRAKTLLFKLMNQHIECWWE